MSETISSNPADYPPGYLAQQSSHKLLATSISFVILELAFAGLRTYARRTKHTPRGIDDWFIWPALVFNLGVCVVNIIVIYTGGVGTHIEALRIYAPHKLIGWAQGIYACEILYCIAVALPKLSILGFYLRFLREPLERSITWVVAFIVAATGIATALTATFQCTPVAYQWDKEIAGGRCIDIQTFYRWMSFPNIVTDAVILVLPLPMIWRLQLERNQKVGITIMFVTGSVGLVSSILRFVAFWSRSAFTDRSWTSVPLLIYTNVEPGTYFIAACMPSLRPVVHTVWQWKLSTFSSRYTSERRSKDTSIRLSSFSMKKSGKDCGFERIHTTDDGRGVRGVDHERGEEDGTQRLVGDRVPDGAIGVTKDVWVERRDV